MNDKVSKPDGRLLNSRQITLFKCLADGLTHHDIAEKTGYKYDSVGVIRSTAIKKCGCNSTAHMIATLFRQKIIS